MTRPTQKTLERRQLALVRDSCPEFLPGPVVITDGNERDEPDLIVRLSTGHVVGLEITALRDREKVGGFTPPEVEAARSEIVAVARRLLTTCGAPRLRVNAGIGQGPYDIELTARTLVEVILRHEFDASGVDLWPAKGDPVELHLSFWPCADDEEDAWSLCAVGETKALCERQIAEAIQRKLRRASEGLYRPGFHELRLLIVATMWPASADFVAPVDARGWAFAHPFDGVFVYCQGDGTLLRY
jgi:hypothetical protein